MFASTSIKGQDLSWLTCTYGPGYQYVHTRLVTCLASLRASSVSSEPGVSAPRVLCAGGGEEAAGARCPLAPSRDRSVQRGVPQPPVTSHQHCRVQVSSTEQ